MTPEEKSGLWLAVLSVLCFAIGPVLVIWADPLSPFEKTAWRMIIGSLVVLLMAVLQGQLPRYKQGDFAKFLLFGLITAAHFLTYMAALNFTTIAHTLTFTYTAPVFVTLFSSLFLKESIARRQYLGILVVVLGIGVLVGFQPRLDNRMLIGDGLALLSAISFGLYSVCGRSQRFSYPLLTYAFAIYGVAGLLMLPTVLFSWTPGGYGLRQIASLIALGVVPLAAGHTLYNAAVRRTHATYVNLIATQEITGGVILGALLLGSLPTLNSIIGAAITLAGIGLVLISRPSRRS